MYPAIESVLFFEQLSYDATEGDVNVVVVVTIAATQSQPTNTVLHVYDIRGDATGGEITICDSLLLNIYTTDMDYGSFDDQVILPAGQQTVKYKVNIYHDELVEENENFEIAMQLVSGKHVYIDPLHDKATITIHDRACKYTYTATTMSCIPIYWSCTLK